MKNFLLFFLFAAFVFINNSKAQAPVINSFSPASGSIGSTVTISGNNFNSNPANNIVFFGSVRANVITTTANSLTVTVPVSAGNQYLSVTNLGTNLTAYASSPFEVTFASYGNIAFDPGINLASSSSPVSVVSSDIDGDGKPDLLVSNAAASSISIYINTSTSGTISFAPKTDFSVTTNPYYLAVGDIDGDGKPDLAITGNEGNSVYVLQNKSTPGNPVFSNSILVATSRHPISIAISDVNEDGKPDIIFVNSVVDISILENTSATGNISFSPPIVISLSDPSGPISVGVNDLDGDGKPDIVTANLSNTISILRNTSVGGVISFDTKVNYATGSNPQSVSIGDLDGDGKPDISIANFGDNTASVFINKSSPGIISFNTKADFTTATGPSFLALGDINGDGKTDLILTSTTSNVVSVLQNTSSLGLLSFGNKTDFPTGSKPVFVSTEDIDGDSKTDLALAITDNSATNIITLFRNNISVVAPTVNAGSDATICQGTTLSLNGIVTGSVNGTVWSADIQGTFLPNANSLNVTFVPWDGYYGIAHVKLTANTFGGSITQVSNNISVTISQTPTVGSIGGAFNICSGNTVQFNTSGTGGVWQSSNPAIASIDNLGLVSAVSAGTTSISYTVTNSNNCSGSISQNLTVFSSPIVAPISGPSTVCVGATIGLTNVTSGGTWTSSDYGIAYVDNQGNVNGIASGDAVISYTVSNSSNCSSIVTYSVHVNNIPSISQITGNTVIVQGATSQLNNLTNGGVWSVDNNLIATINNSGLISAVSAGSASVVYQFTDLNNCTAKASTPILVIAGVAVAPITGSNSVCQNSNIQLSDATQGGSWSVSDNTIAFIDQSGKLSGINPGVVTITYSVSSGGVTGSVTMLFTVLAGASSGISGNAILCQGAVNTFTSPTPGGVWSIDNLAVATVDNAGKVSGISSGTANVTYTVTNSNGCSSSASLPVTVNPTPIVASITGANSVCSGSSIQLTDLTPGGTWLSNNPNALLDNTGKLSYFTNLNGLATISYSITGSNGCVGSASQIVQLYATPGFSSILGYPVVCIGNSSQLSNLVSGGVWSSSNPFVASVDNTGKITGITSGTSTISYVVTNAGGCSSTATQVATVNALPVVSSITGPSAVCMGSTIQLNNATSGGSWSSNNASVATISSTGLVTPHAVGVATISYQVTNSNGCTTTITQNITVNSIPVIPAITGTGNICLGSTLQLSDALSGGVWTILGSPINATITSSGLVTPTALGSVLVQYQVTNVSGCSASVFTNFNISSAPTVAAITGSNSVCTGATVQLSDVTAGGVWSSSNSAVASVNSSGLVTGVASGTANIFYNFTNASGCVATASFTITVAQLMPSITSFSPSSGPVGSLVTITGNNLSNITSFSIGGVSAIPVSNDGSTLVAFVMPGTTIGNVSISTLCGNTSSSNNFTISDSKFPGIQQGNKLIGTGNIGAAFQGYTVSLSADGNTALVGGYGDNSFIGAAWVFTRSGSNWVQQGNKLVGSGNVGASFQGRSVALSADGNTAIVGGFADNANKGAAWIYTRSGNTWSQQGSKLVGTGGVGTSRQGQSVAISADGNTVIVGGYQDNSSQGAVWVFTRSGNTWTQQGNKLVGTGSVGVSNQGMSVSLSADGNTVIVGGYQDNSNQGAAWIFTRTGNTWTQQGNKLVGTGSVGAANQGMSVSINADGTRAIVGGYNDNGSYGAAWIYNRVGNAWSQEGNKLVATGSNGPALQGYAVSLNADGNTAVIGGRADNTNVGAAWIFTRNGNTWLQIGNKMVGSGNVGTSFQGISATISSDATTALVGGFGDNTNQGATWVYTVEGPPSISSISPTSGTVGSVITLTGSNFTGTTSVSFGGIPAASFQIISNTTISATVAAGATGNVIVTTPVGSATLGGFVFSLPTAVITGSTSVCQNGVNPSVSFTGANGVAPYTFTYNLNGGPNQTVTTTSANTAILSVPTNISGTFTYNLVSVTDNNNISNLQSGTAVITVNPLPVVNLTASGALSFCSGGSVTLSSSSISGNVWSTGETTPSIIVNQSGNYSVTTTDVNGCSVTSTPTSVTVNPLPVVNVTASGPLSFCSGGSVTLSSSSASGNVWSTGETTSSIIVNLSGNYSVTITDVNGCSASSSPSSFTVNPLPVVNVTASGPLSFCDGGSVTLSSSSLSGNVWSSGETTQSIIVNQTGNYSVTITDVNGCSASSSQSSVTVNPLPVVNVTASGPLSLCDGGSVTLSTSSVSGNVWSSGETTQSIIVNQSGNFSVTVTDVNGCSATSTPTSITVNPLPVVNFTASGPLSFCDGGSVILSSSSLIGNVWSTGELTQSITVNQTGGYSVMVTDGNGCSASTSAASVFVNALPDNSVTTSGPTAFCVGGSVVLTAATGNTYAWSTGETSQSITVSQSGNFSVTLSNQNGCTNTSSVIPVTVSPLPIVSVTASGVLSFCTGGSVVLTSSSATGNVWSTGETTASIVVTQSGNYTVNVTNADECSTTTSPISVTVIPLPPSVITVTSSNNCTVRLSANTGTGLSYQWLRNGITINGATTNVYTARLDGSYTVAVSQYGCSNLSLPQNILISDITPPVVKTKNITVSLNATGTATITPAQINNGSTDNCIISNISLDQTMFTCANIGANTVTLTVTDGGGNASSATAIVTVQDITIPVVRTKAITIQLDANGSAFITPSQVDNGSTDNCSIASMSVLPNSFTCANTGNNIVTLTVTDVNGNTATKTATVTVQDKILPVVVTQNITVQLNAAGTATITAAQIDNGSTDNCGIASMSVSPATFNCSKVGLNTVTLTVKDTKGNISTGTAQVTVEDNIAPVVITKNISVALTSAGSVTITPAQVNSGSSDKCGITTMVLDNSTFHCSDIGTNLVTLTITDVHGNTSSATATVTVVGEIPAASITSAPANNTFTGGVATNLYLGYGPKSTTLKVIAPATGAPYKYQWSGTGSLSSLTSGAPVFTPTAAGSYTFIVNATNKYGCSSSASITICVTDIRVSGLTNYVYVCNGTQSIAMATSAVNAYFLANPSARLGNCSQAPCGLQILSTNKISQSTVAPEAPVLINTGESLNVMVMPNPSNNYFTLKIESRFTEPISLRVIDVSGKVIDSKNKIVANSTLQIGHNYSSGIYYAEIIQGNRRKVKQLIKVAR